MTAHQKKMAMKKARRATMTRGFMPVTNKRVDAAIRTATALLIVQGVHPAEAQEKAFNQVAASLPRETKRRLAPRPSKSDDPVYRKETVRDPRRAAA